MKKTIYRIISFAFLMFIGVFFLNVKVYAASNVIAYNSIRNDMANMLIDEYINQIEHIKS